MCTPSTMKTLTIALPRVPQKLGLQLEQRQHDGNRYLALKSVFESSPIRLNFPKNVRKGGYILHQLTHSRTGDAHEVTTIKSFSEWVGKWRGKEDRPVVVFTFYKIK